MDSIVLRRVVPSAVYDCKATSKHDFCCMISQFDCATRVPFSTDGATMHMLTPLPLRRTCNVQYVAPEVWNGGNCDHENGSRPFDAYAADLWAVGVILLAMLFGNEAIFVAPVPEDRIFQQISVHGQLKEFAATRTAVVPCPSDDALDLLQHLLLCDPQDRPTLAEVKQYPWLLRD
jgi:serine/threonine protein kinase